MADPPTPRPQVAALPAYHPGKAAEAADTDDDVADAIKLASNELPHAPAEGVQAALADAASTAQLYPDHLAVGLRAAIAEHLGVDAQRVAVGCGSVGLLQQLALAYAGPADEVVYGDPSFEAYPVFTGLTGATPVAVPLRRHTLDAEAIAASITERTRLVLLATPNNPTGTALRHHDLETIVAAAPAHCLVVVDEAYREFVTGADVPDAVTACENRPNVAVTRTFSKAHGLAGLRVGYLVADPDVVVAVDKVLIPFAVNAAAQAGARAALAAAESTGERVTGVIDERERLVRALRERGLGVPDAQANFVWLPAGSASLDLAQRLERRGLVTRPFADTGVRVTVSVPDDNDRFLRALGDVAGEIDLESGWLGATGASAAAAQDWLDRVAAAVADGPPPTDALSRAIDRLRARIAGLDDADWATGPATGVGPLGGDDADLRITEIDGLAHP